MADKPGNYLLTSIASQWVGSGVKLPPRPHVKEQPIRNCSDCPIGNYVSGCLLAGKMLDGDQAVGAKPPPSWCPIKEDQLILYRVTREESPGVAEPDEQQPTAEETFAERMRRRREGNK